MTEPKRRAAISIWDASPEKKKEVVTGFCPSPLFIGTDWNGYGYEKKTYIYVVNRRQYNVVRDILDEETAKKAEKVKRTPKTEEERTDAWACRLSRLTGISVEEAREIAEEKKMYHIERINELIERDYERGCSVMRGKLIRRLERENPLRTIKDADHANAIISASKRHKETDYELRLSAAHELEELGIVERGTARDLARTNTMKELQDMGV